ncbi:MAG: putative toxin-antitoxin system toxin component, PIN family [Candidatus Omnitrophica bacterium]|nr:putative toxin-antitoxin system toxin component, PIN family [Candidatus Omnitrophota bacterium]
MNIVLDTNVFVSGLFFKGGAPHRILRAWQSEQFILYASAEILNEYERVIRELVHVRPTVDPDKAIFLIHKNVQLVKSFILPRQVCDDPDDDKFISCALTIKASIVSGDKALLRTAGYKNLVVLTPAQFERQYLI